MRDTLGEGRWPSRLSIWTIRVRLTPFPQHSFGAPPVSVSGTPAYHPADCAQQTQPDVHGPESPAGDAHCDWGGVLPAWRVCARLPGPLLSLHNPAPPHTDAGHRGNAGPLAPLGKAPRPLTVIANSLVPSLSSVTTHGCRRPSGG